jgi:DnaJ-class molecular chaperone
VGRERDCNMCRASQQRSRAQAGEDRRHDLTISFKDAVFGCSVDIDVDKMEG